MCVDRSAIAELREQRRTIARRFGTATGRGVASMLAAADSASELSKAFRNHFVLARRTEGKAMLERAIADGQVRATVDLDVVLDMRYGPCSSACSWATPRSTDGSWTTSSPRRCGAWPRRRSARRSDSRRCRDFEDRCSKPALLSEAMQKLVRRSVSFELTKHCNLRCARCDHSSPWFDEAFASVERFEADLRALTAAMELDELRFAGGEPLLHPELNQFFRIAREHRFAAGITMLSNGVLLHTMQDETWHLIDALIVSTYPGVRHRFDADAIRRKAEAHDVLLLIEEEHRFDQMLVNDRIPDHRAVEAIYRGCYSATHCHTVYEGRYYKCSRAHLLDERMVLSGRPPIGNQPIDGIALHGDPDLRATLAAYLASDRYLDACHYCLGSHGRPHEHVQLRKKADIEAEQRASHTDFRALLKPDAELDPDRIARHQPFPLGWWRHDGDQHYRMPTDHRVRKPDT
jgi:hypothetical protein